MIRIGIIAAVAATLAFAAPAIATAPSACGDKTAAPAKTIPTTAAKVQIPIEGMTCEGCAISIRNVLVGIAGVYDATVDHQAGQAVVSYDTKLVTKSALVEAINKAGYKPGTPAKPGV